ncbi:MAG: MTH938/NDUFAF3 family protein [Gammaproteobacteria bacterium]|nr:MTH938/NDUFAF3 family protein [Gammaproteobacteria bacterium]
MKISLEIGDGIYRVQASRPGSVTLTRGTGAGVAESSSEQSASFLLTPDQLIPAWGPLSVEDVGEAELLPVLDLKPAVVLLGTGNRPVLPDMGLMQLFLSRGIGFETMQTPAACRTFNLLAYEGRRVVAALIVE